jgi:hypothetical protein
LGGADPAGQVSCSSRYAKRDREGTEECASRREVSEEGVLESGGKGDKGDHCECAYVKVIWERRWKVGSKRGSNMVVVRAQ